MNLNISGSRQIHSNRSTLSGAVLLFVVWCLSAPAAAFSQQANAARLFPARGEVLYIITDKTLYTPGEVIWFAGYLLPGSERPDSLVPDLLSVALLGAGAKDYAVKKNYFISRGLCAGSLLLPDTLPPGDYRLIAGANITVAGRPLQYFSSVITVKHASKPAIATAFSITDEPDADSVFVSAQAQFADGRYITGNGNTLTFRLSHQEPKTAKLSGTGYLRIGIPRAELEKSDFILRTVAICNKHSSNFDLHLPGRKPDTVKVDFYPQNGYVKAGMHQQVRWTAFSGDNQPQALKAHLLEDGDTLNAVATDETGLGIFVLAPKPGSHYALQLAGGNLRKLYPLPAPMRDGLVMDLAAPLPDNDTLEVSVRSDRETVFTVAIAGLKDTFSMESGRMAVSGARDLKIPVGPLPRGLHTISLLDEQGRPVAASLFFAHYRGNTVITVSTEKEVFAPREQVKVAVSLKDTVGNRLGGIFTARCVLLDRIDPDRQPHIDQYYYFGYWLPANPVRHLLQDKAAAEQRLAMVNTSHLQGSPVFLPPQKVISQGRVVRTDKGKISKGMNVMLYRESGLQLLKTDGGGNFSVDASDMAVTEGNPMWIKVAGASTGNTQQQQASGYAIALPDPMHRPMQALKALYAPLAVRRAGIVQSAMAEVVKDALAPVQLKTVVVKGRSVVLSDAAYGNKCGDFVCEGGVLNCNHNSGGKGVTIPEEGRSYRIRIPHPPYYTTMYYRGCMVDNISPVYVGRRFEGMDSVKLASPEVPAMLSTVFWAPFIVADGKGDVEIPFFTSDLTGRYKIIVEGIDTRGMVFRQEKIITVTSAKAVRTW